MTNAKKTLLITGANKEGCLPKPAKSSGFLWISHFAPRTIF